MIAILGGGITALAAAIELKKRGKDFVLIEKSARLGGKIISKNVDGYQMELGPNTVLINHPETKEFLEHLDLYDKRIEPDPKAIKRRFVLKNGKIQPIPHSFGSLLSSKLFGLNTVFSILKEPFKSQRVKDKEESLADFSKRRFSDQIYDDLITPFVSGIYAGDPEKMSLKYVMPLLDQAEKKYGSVIKGMPKLIKEKRKHLLDYDMPRQKIFSFENGLQHMIDEAGKIISAHLRLQSAITSIEQIEDKYSIRLSGEQGDEEIIVDQVISTLPASILSSIISFDDPFRSALSKINYVPAVVSHLAFDAAQWKFYRGGFGLLSRKTEKEPWLGILFNSEFFPQQQQGGDVLLTVISGGYRQPDLIRMKDEEILQALNQSINKIGLAEGDAKFHHIYRWEKAIPQYELGYAWIESEIDRFSKEHSNFQIAGNYYKGVSVSDCIANGTILAREI